MTDKTKKIDKKPIKELVKILDELELTELSYKDENFSITVSKASKGNFLADQRQDNNTSPQESKENNYKNDPRAIKSPMVGTVYLQHEPGANKFVNVGDQIKNGQTVLIIEAMKTMNPIESSLQGKVIKVLVENEQAVEFGQPLMLIE